MTEEKTDHSAEELMVMMEGQIKALTGIAIQLLCLAAPETSVAKGDPSLERIAKTLAEAAWEKTKAMMKGQSSGVVESARKLHEQIFQIVYAQLHNVLSLRRVDRASERKLPEKLQIQLTDGEMIAEEEKAIMKEPLVANTAALEEQILLLIRESRSRMDGNEQWRQWYVESMALTYSLGEIASDYQLSKDDVEFLEEKLGYEICSLRTKQREIGS